jgi:hypothetical protein
VHNSQGRGLHLAMRHAARDAASHPDEAPPGSAGLGSLRVNAHVGQKLTVESVGTGIELVG